MRQLSALVLTIIAVAGSWTVWTGNVAWGQCHVNETTKLVASDAITDESFGNSVAMDGDVAVIGAVWDDDLDTHTGSAYVFRYDGASWNEEDKLLAADGEYYDHFAQSVAISGNVIIVGAPDDDDDKGANSGSAYVFRFNGSAWVQEDKLVASTSALNDHFGCAVGIAGDVAVIGAKQHGAVATQAGAAYVFRYNGSTWDEEATLLASDAAARDLFGCDVSISNQTVLVGAWSDEDGGDDYAGSAYIFEHDGLAWTQQAKLTASDRQGSDYFGAKVAISGNTAVIGASGDDDKGSAAGAAYVFTRPAGGWNSMTETAKLVALDGAAGDAFGEAVAIDGDVVAVGAFGDDDFGSMSGSAYLYRLNGASWQEQAKLHAFDAAQDDRFGRAAAVSGNHSMFGAPWDDDAGNNSGATYVFTGVLDCNENEVMDMCDIANGTSSDADDNGIPDECESAPLITGWESVRYHGIVVGDQAIALDPADSEAVSEPRRDGVQKMRVSFDLDVSDQLPVPIEAEDLTHGGAIPASFYYFIDDGFTLVFEFVDGLPDGACYRIDLGAVIPQLGGDTDCIVVALAGDTNGDGFANLTDMSQVKSKDGQPLVPDNVRFDVNLDGSVNLTDMSLVKSLDGGSASCP